MDYFTYPLVIYGLLTVLGLCVGSLLNVIIYRLPIMIKNQWTAECSAHLDLPDPNLAPINLFFPRSFCPSCKNMIQAWQNIPLLSYVFLRGQCYYCKHPIPMRYPFIELLTGLLFLFTSWHFGIQPALFFALIFVTFIIILFFIDLDEQLLPDSITLSLLWIGLLANTQNLFTNINDAVFSAVIAYLSLWLFINIYYLITGKIGMGNGDFKLFAALAAWFGWVSLPLILLFSCISGSIVGLLYLRLSNQNSQTPIPFGPFLCIAGLITLFWGKSLLAAYLSIM